MRTENSLVNFNRGTRYLEKSKYDKALACFKAEVKVSDFKELWLNMGNTLRRMGRDDEAIQAYKTSCDPATPYAHNSNKGPYDFALTNLGLMYYRREDDLTACRLYTEALEVNPNHYDAAWNLSAALLRRHYSGEVGIDLAEAWALYECRFYRSTAQSKVDATLPRWDGVSGGRSIVVLGEQGIGDRLQWGKWIHLLEAKFDTVWVQCPEDMDIFFSRWRICRAVVESDAEVSVPICSLARYFIGVDVRDDWCRDVEVEPVEVFKGKCLNIGVCWAGNPTHANDVYRSCGPEWFLDLAKVHNLYCLTPGIRGVKGIKNVEPKTWAETIAWVRAVDVVVTVDTSLVHLCGVLGEPCILLQPLKETDFRWGNSNTVGNPVYGSVKIIRNPNSWKVVFAEVNKVLKDLC